jgi:hypothetical protein
MRCGQLGLPRDSTIALRRQAFAESAHGDREGMRARTDIDPDTREALRSAFGSVAGRLKEGGEEVNALAKDLRSQLARTDIDPDMREALRSAFGSVAGRLKEGGEEVNALAKDLRSRLARTDIDRFTRAVRAQRCGLRLAAWPDGSRRAVRRSTRWPRTCAASSPGPTSIPIRGNNYAIHWR